MNFNSTSYGLSYEVFGAVKYMAPRKKKVSRASRSKLRRDYVLPKMSEDLRYLTVQGTLLDHVRSVVTLPLKIDRSQMGEHLPSLFNLLERMPNANRTWLSALINQHLTSRTEECPD